MSKTNAKAQNPENNSDDLKEAIATLNKSYGAQFITTVHKLKRDLVRIPTGILTLDRALGGGLPQGKIIELFGAPADGKTTIALHIVGQWQKLGKICAWFDFEDSFESEWAKQFGIDVERLLYSKPTTGEEGYDAMLALMGRLDLIVVDSVAAMAPSAALERSNLKSGMANNPRMHSAGLEKIMASVGGGEGRKTNILLINQLTTNFKITYGDNQDSTGGNKIKFLSSVRIRVNRVSSKLDEDVDRRGHRLKAHLKKNRFYIPHKTAEFNLMYSGRFDKYEQLINLISEFQPIAGFARAGAFYSHEDQKFQGAAKLAKYLRDNPKIMNELEREIYKRINGERSGGYGDEETGLAEELSTAEVVDESLVQQGRGKTSKKA